MVAGLSGLVTCLQSNLIGPNFRGLFSNLGVRGLFSSPFVSYWAHIDRLAPGYLMGAGSPIISVETETQVWAACQLWQPHSGQNIGVSASTSDLPMYTQGWSPLGWTGWISLQSKGLSRVFSNTTAQKHQFFGAQLSLESNSHSHTWLLEKP